MIRPADVVLPALFGVIGTVETVWEGYGPLWGSIGAYWLAAIVLCARRAFPLVMPLAVAAIILGAALVGVETDEPASWLLPLGLAYLAAGLYVPRSRAPAGLASVLASTVLIAFDAGNRDEPSWDALLLIALALGPWVTGVALARTRERSRELRGGGGAGPH